MALGGPTATPHFQLQQHSHSFIARGAPAAGPPHSASAPSLSTGGGAGFGGGPIARMPLRVASAYSAALSSEPLFTTCHDKFIGASRRRPGGLLGGAPRRLS